MMKMCRIYVVKEVRAHIASCIYEKDVTFFFLYPESEIQVNDNKYLWL